MKNKILVVLALFWSVCVNAQKELLINELDCDSPGLDTQEFIELRSIKPNFPLDGFVLVFFNGSSSGGNSCYLALDLDGYQTDVNGIFLIGPSTLIPFPHYIIPENTIQNGEDAVAIYKGEGTDFPIGKVAFFDTRLIDVLIYGTSDPDAVTMLQIFKAFDPNIRQINEGSANNTNSIQRKNDGTYYVGIPTPRKLNDGSGVILTGIKLAFNKQKYTEGDTIQITFQIDQIIESNLVIEFSVNNGTFNLTDIKGELKITLQKNQYNATTSLIILDDKDDEGDEELVFKMAPLPEKYFSINNNVRIRVDDNDFKIADFGTPLNPTYGRVKAQYDKDYYHVLNGKSGNDLKWALQSIIANPLIVRAQTYNDLIDILKEADQNPENSNQIWQVYLEKGRSKLDFQTSSDNNNAWNREHVWPRSRGGFNSIDEDEQINGKNIFWSTGPDSLRHANSDAHGIRAVNGVENSNRGNKYFGQYSGPAGTKGKFKGDVARCIFFLAVRYNGLQVVGGYPEGQIGKFGDLDTLLAWHRVDVTDDFEMNRNNLVFDWQKNRNPFIDLPDLVEYVYGNKKGLPYRLSNTVHDVQHDKYTIFPNPGFEHIHIKGIGEETEIRIIDNNGKMLLSKTAFEDTLIDVKLSAGIYFIKLKTFSQSVTKTIIVR
ncbi:MAG: endonuclease [Saprospiraceae bacterium]|nr:endonuclease [Saprospiraceae bacterium]